MCLIQSDLEIIRYNVRTNVTPYSGQIGIHAITLRFYVSSADIKNSANAYRIAIDRYPFTIVCHKRTSLRILHFHSGLVYRIVHIYNKFERISNFYIWIIHVRDSLWKAIGVIVYYIFCKIRIDNYKNIMSSVFRN